MSPTSYQTAPPRVKIIATGSGRVKRRRLTCIHDERKRPSLHSVFQLVPFARRDDFRRIDRFAVDLFF